MTTVTAKFVDHKGDALGEGATLEVWNPELTPNGDVSPKMSVVERVSVHSIADGVPVPPLDNLIGGPLFFFVNVGRFRRRYLVNVPKTGTHDFVDLVSETIPYEPWVAQKAGQYASAAQASANASAGFASQADQHRQDALGHSEASALSAGAASASEQAAAASEQAAALSATAADTSKAQAAGSASAAADSAQSAASSATAAETARSGAETAAAVVTNNLTAINAAPGAAQDAADARDAAEGHKSAAAQSAQDAAQSETNAAGSATAASQSATQAADARDIADGHRSAAAASASAASTSKDAAATSAGQSEDSRILAEDAATRADISASQADSSATRAETAADSFDLTATATTGAAGSNATVAVTGDGPTYSLSFTVPRGDKGDRGPKGERGDDGEVTQGMLDAAVASLVDNAPEALDTLTELAAALGNDPNFATTVSTEIGKRVLIDGAPAAYNTLGKLVTALQNHELGGSTDASLLTGALADQVDASAANVVMDMTELGGPSDFSGPLAEHLIQGYYATVATGRLGTDIDSKADKDHTHDGADITGALTDQVDASEAAVTVSGETANLATRFQALADVIVPMHQALGNKSDKGHTHDGADISGALTDQVDASEAFVTITHPHSGTFSMALSFLGTGMVDLDSRVVALESVAERVNAAPATWHWSGTTLPTAASQVHAQARVGDFIVAPNLDTDPGWHQITGV